MNHPRMGVRSPWMAAGGSTLRLHAFVLRGAPWCARCCWALRPPPSSSRLLLCLVRRTRTLAAPSAAGVAVRECSAAATHSPLHGPLSGAAREPARVCV